MIVTIYVTTFEMTLQLLLLKQSYFQWKIAVHFQQNASNKADLIVEKHTVRCLPLSGVFSNSSASLRSCSPLL